MDTTRKLLLWVIATDGPSEEEQLEAQALILTHYEAIGMTIARLQVIVGPGSMLSMIVA